MELDLRFVAAGRGGFEDAVVEVVVEEPEGDGFEGAGHRGDLGEDLDAVLLVFDHVLEAAGLSFDAAQAAEVLVLVGDVAVGAGGVVVLDGLLGHGVLVPLVPVQLDRRWRAADGYGGGFQPLRLLSAYSRGVYAGVLFGTRGGVLCGFGGVDHER